MVKPPVHIAVSGAAGRISYSLLFRLIEGDLLGPHQPVVLSLLETPEMIADLEGVVMELVDCAAPLLQGVSCHVDPFKAFADVDFVFLVGAKPRGPGVERKDLLEENACIFSEQGKALNQVAKRDVKVLVVGNPANTNTLIVKSNAADIDPGNFAAMTRLDHNRSVGLLAERCGCLPGAVRRVIVWGNHSTTQYPDLHHATVEGRPALDWVDERWYEQQFIPIVQNRGAEVIRLVGKSSAASAAKAAIDQMRDWIFGTPDQDWTSMAVCSDGSYGVEPGLIYSFPVTSSGGIWKIVPGLETGEFSRARIQANVAEIRAERDMIRHLIP